MEMFLEIYTAVIDDDLEAFHLLRTCRRSLMVVENRLDYLYLTLQNNTVLRRRSFSFF